MSQRSSLWYRKFLVNALYVHTSVMLVLNLGYFMSIFTFHFLSVTQEKWEKISWRCWTRRNTALKMSQSLVFFLHDLFFWRSSPKLPFFSLPSYSLIFPFLQKCKTELSGIRQGRARPRESLPSLLSTRSKILIFILSAFLLCSFILPKVSPSL